jgi:hypothetical protein
VRTPPADYVPYAERRPYVVASSLNDLRGPTTGVITLPHHLDWSGDPHYDLDKPAVLLQVRPRAVRRRLFGCR